MKFTTVSALAALGLVAAQSIPQCVVTCSTQAAAAAGCTSYTDVTCVCTNAAFQNAAGACLVANCTADEQTAATSLQQVLCAGQSVTGGSVTATISASGTSSIDASAIASLTASDSAASSSAASIASSAASGASASASTSASAASASASASSASASASAGTSGSASGNAASSASSAAATSGGSNAANRVEVGFKGIVASLVGVVGFVGGAALVL